MNPHNCRRNFHMHAIQPHFISSSCSIQQTKQGITTICKGQLYYKASGVIRFRVMHSGVSCHRARHSNSEKRIHAILIVILKSYYDIELRTFVGRSFGQSIDRSIDWFTHSFIHVWLAVVYGLIFFLHSAYTYIKYNFSWRWNEKSYYKM